MRTAVIYARFSCSKQREASIDDQLRVCHEWCDREGYEVVSQYCDHAVSGRTDDRPEFQRMLSNCWRRYTRGLRRWNPPTRRSAPSAGCTETP